MTLTILNDVHIGAVRTGGTTPATAYQLRQALLAQFEEKVQSINGDLMILGDLFDGPRISMADLLRTFQILSGYLAREHEEGLLPRKLILVNGNHDLSKDSTNFSSFQLLAKLLVEMAPNNVLHIEQPTLVAGYDMYVIPHLVNQDLFNLAIDSVPSCTYLAVHCNYDNQFAVESDHSLNLSREQAETLKVEHIIFAHEHQQREELGDKIVVIGNQWPSSVSDCLGNKSKRCLLLSDEGLSEETTWVASGDYEEQDWRQIEDSGCRFIRVTGLAEPEEAAAVATAISRFRAASTALVITNAVKIGAKDQAVQLALSHEQITAFNVLEELRKILTPEENKKINELLEKSNA